MGALGGTDWIVGGGELGELVRRADWASSPLGPRVEWSQSMRTMVSLVVESPVAMALVWGRDYALIYNDAFRELVGDEHPRALGHSVLETWPNAGGFVAEVDALMLRGEPAATSQTHLSVRRDGRHDDILVHLSLSPVREGDGTIGGSLVTVRSVGEVLRTSAEIALRQHRQRESFLARLGDALRPLARPEDVMNTAACALGEGLRASGVVYANIIGEKLAVVGGSYARGRAPAGSRVVEPFSENILARLKRGEVFTFENANADPGLPDAARVTARALGVVAAMIMGLVKDGRLIGILSVHDTVERRWNDFERELLRATAERVWSALEAVRSSALLRESTERLRLVLQRSPIVLFTQDSDLRYTWYHDVRSVFVDVVGKRDDELVAGEEGVRLLELKQRVLRTGQPATDVVHLDIGEQRAWYEFYAEPLLDDHDKVVGLTGAAVDVTDRKAAEHTQRLYEQSEERLLDLDAMERLHKVGTLFLRSQDRGEILDAILDAAVAITEADCGILQVYDSCTSDLAIVSSRGLPSSWSDCSSRAQTPCGLALERGERVLIDDVSTSDELDEDARRRLLDAGIRAVQSTPLFSRTGTPLGAICTQFQVPGRPGERTLRLLDLLARQAADLLDRARADDELRFSQSKYSSILMSSADAIISVDDRRIITEWNQGAEKMFGYSRAEAMGTSLERLLPERHRAAHRGHVAQFAGETVAARAMDHEATVGLRKNGEEFPISATISRVEIRGQRIMTVAVRDVSEQKRIETEQRLLAEVGGVLASLDYEAAMEALPKAVVGSLADFVAVLAFDAGVLRRVGAAHVDPRISANISRTVPNLDLGYSSWQAFREHRPIALEVTPDRYEQIAKSPEHLRFLRITRPSATLTVPLLALGNCVGVLGLTKCKGRFSSRDIQLAAEIARRIALFIENARLHAAERRATKTRDEVLGVVAHDLRNPLNAIVLQSGLLRRRGPEPERRNMKPVDLIKRYAMRMNSLIQDLLDVSQMEAGQIRLDRSKVTIDKLIHEAVESHRAPLAERAIPLEIDTASDLPEVWADGGRVIQVLDNLISNASKLTIRGRIAVGARLEKGEIRVWVSDTGPGIAPEDSARVFDRFWQAGTSKRGGGAGLGLAIVKGIVEAHGGRAWVESRLGEGATFFFTLPVATGFEKELGRTGERAKAVIPFRERSVLLADDDPDTREGLAALLRSHGYRVSLVPNGEEALKCLQRAPRPDLVILDLSMPVMNGWEVLESRRQTGDLRALPFIVISALANAADRVAALHADFLPKPVSPERLLSLMESALAGGLPSERSFRLA